MNKGLADIFQRKRTQLAATPRINWDERRDTYLAAVQALYNQIKSMLADPIKKKQVTLRKRPKQLTENYIGTYAADDLLLIIGDEQVRFSPRGRNIVGAAGRVDVIGERGEAVLVVQPDARWGFVQSRQPTLRIVPFDDSTLAEVLRLVMRD